MIRSLIELDKQLYSSFSKMYKNKNVDCLKVKGILQKYNGKDWKNYVSESNSNKYHRNIYKSGIKNNMYELIIITWFPNNYSKIHNHADNGCLLKVLDGELIEKKYTHKLEEYEEIKYCKNEISYMNNNLGLHSILNNKKTPTISLHIYSPPRFKTKFYK